MDDEAIAKYINLAERLDKPKLSAEQEYWQGRADSLALSQKRSMAVIKIDGHHQIWSLAKAGKDYVYVAEYVQEVAI
jgi:hypothetical protein